MMPMAVEANMAPAPNARMPMAPVAGAPMPDA